MNGNRIVSNGAVKYRRRLRDCPNSLSQCLVRDLSDVDAINVNRPRILEKI